MNDQKLKSLVSEAVSLDREIELQTGRLKDLKLQLIDLAARNARHKTGTDGGGWSVALEGLDGCIARVTQPAPRLKSSLDAEKPAGAKLMQLAGRFKEQLFIPVLKYAPVPNFRDRVPALFDQPVARKIIAACESESAPCVSFETKESEV